MGLSYPALTIKKTSAKYFEIKSDFASKLKNENLA
jgi:hypothetical protein